MIISKILGLGMYTDFICIQKLQTCLFHYFHVAKSITSFFPFRILMISDLHVVNK